MRRVVPFAMVVLVALEWNGIRGQPARDSLAYHQAAADARANGPLYDPPSDPGPHSFVGRWPYLYPPPLAALVSLFPQVSYRTFDRIWLLLNFTSFWVFAASLGRIQVGRWSRHAALTWGAGLFLIPGSVLAIHFANVEPVVWALVGLAFAVPATTGLLLVLAASFKLTPAWALLSLATRRPRWVVPQAILGTALLSILCVGVVGAGRFLSDSLTWWTRVLPPLTQGQFWGGSLAVLRQGIGPLDILGNLSLSFVPIQLAVLAGWDYQGGLLPLGLRLYLTAVGILTPLLVLWRTRRMPALEQAAFVLVSAALAAPIVRPYVLPLALLPLALWVSRKPRGPASGRPSTG